MAAENPLADYGTIVTGGRFIGRQDGLRAIDARVVRPNEPGNLAIIGQPRIGKSSLAYQGIMARTQDLLKQKIVPIWLNLATFDEASDLFRELVTSCRERLQPLADVAAKIDDRSIGEALRASSSKSEHYRAIQRYFRMVREAGVRVVFVLDEFDHARNLFRGDISGFQMIRELSYRPEWRVAFVTTSRRAIRDIELQSQSISTLDGIFLKYYVQPFQSIELDEYFTRLSSANVNISEIDRKVFADYCDGVPFLLDVLGYELAERRKANPINGAEESAHAVQRQLIDHYEHLVDHLREDGTLSAALQVLFGPVFDATQAQITELNQYGLIRRSDDGIYLAFSKHFGSYLRLIGRTADIWPTWRQTEVALRTTISSKLLEQYGDDWAQQLEKSRPNLRTIFEEARTAQEKEQRQFGDRASSSLIDYAYPKQLFDIIFAEWATLSQVFGKDKPYWDQRAQFLAKIRTPLAHNRVETLDGYERQIIEGYCNEILKVIEVHMS